MTNGTPTTTTNSSAGSGVGAAVAGFLILAGLFYIVFIHESPEDRGPTSFCEAGVSCQERGSRAPSTTSSIPFPTLINPTLFGTPLGTGSPLLPQRSPTATT